MSTSDLVCCTKNLLHTYPDASRMQLLRTTLAEFRELYAANQTLTEAVTPQWSGEDDEQRVDLAAWTMMAHSLMNLELAKVKR